MLGDESTCECSLAEVAEELMRAHFKSGRRVMLLVQGWSMGYTLGPSREIAVMPFARPPRPGDVVLFKASNTFIAHRIIRKVGGGQFYITKGDNCATADAPVVRKDILGHVVGIKDGGVIRNPWHWKPPFCVFAALMSRFENQGCPQTACLFSRIRYLGWRCRKALRQSRAKNCSLP